MSVSNSPRIRNRTQTPTRRRKRSYARRVLLPLLAKLTVVAVALVLGTALVGKVLRPIRLVNNEQRQKDRIVAEYKALRAQNEGLRRQLRFLQTPDGVAREARKHGFVKPGEISLVITNSESNPKNSH